ncbi:hypothetical protein ACEWY4_019996 [Coilia grayii]|uniref:IRG-type G domain-containing protein n=1 Tax=Coilia grayii TaxID=363190 RepID=A0ABD1JBD4_9TELE
MERKLSEDHMKLMLAAWKMAPRVTRLDDQLLAVLELYERFQLDVVVTGGIPEANTRLARAVCGLSDEDHFLTVEEEEEEDDDEEAEEDESDETEEEQEQGDMSEAGTERGETAGHRHKNGRIVWRTEHGLPVVSHPDIPNVRIWVLNGQPASYTNSPNHTGFVYDLLVVLTSELHQEDHMGLVMALREKDQPLYLVRADREMDLVKEELKGPCKTCAWERMRDRNLEIQRRRRERQMTQDSQDGPHKLEEMKDIGGVLLSVLPEMRKKAFCQFMVDVSQELKVPKLLRNNTKSTILPAVDIGKVTKEDIEHVSDFLQAKDLVNHPSRLLSILNAMETFRLDVGVLGPTGGGSSSFVNALLGLKGGDKGAAPTGVTETTLEPVAYQYPQLPNVALWDLSGIGRIGGLSSAALAAGPVEDGPLASALHPTCDVYILLSPLRLSMDCVRLLHHISVTGKQCYLVLSKADQLDEESVGEVKRWSEEVLSQLGYQQTVYAVSALQPEGMDFSKFTETLHLSISCHKRRAFAQHTAKMLEQEIWDKRTELCKTM